jgi:anti-sigma regulatory factor (Ser/Thr protein kinase)
VNPGGAPRRDGAWSLTITSDTANLAVLRETVTRAALAVGFQDPTVSQITLAVDEAIGNVIKHGYDGRPGQPIEVSIEPFQRADQRGLQIVVCDCGRQVDPATIVGRELSEVRPGGLGTHIIRNVMDEVEYSLRQPQGMRLRMAKLLKTSNDELRSVCQAQEDSADAR